MEYLANIGFILLIGFLLYVVFVSHNNKKTLRTLSNEMRRVNQLLSELAGIEEPTADPVVAAAKVYVGNIDYAATEAELGDYFARYGKVEVVNIPVNRYTGKARGFGFITFASQQEAEKAMVLNGSEFKGRQIQVNFAKERE